MVNDEKLKDIDYIQQCGWGKVLGHLRKQFDYWATEHFVKKGYKGFKLAYMPVIMNIDMDGTNNNDLAKRAQVTKQAMSKVVKELHKMGYITSRTDPDDKRSVIFLLTAKGKNFIVSARASVGELMNEYREVLGKKNFDELLSNMVKLVHYNHKKLHG
jgi:DNA-binding MarR family transcriptional regulator